MCKESFKSLGGNDALFSIECFGAGRVFAACS